MIKLKKELIEDVQKYSDGKKLLSMYDLSGFEGINKKIKQFSLVELEPNEMVGFHVHNGDSENYFIVSGKGLYSDNGELKEVSDGTITFTPSGCGHSLKNIGNGVLSFIALVIEND